MIKPDEIQKERMRLEEIFKDIEPNRLGLIDGLIDDAAFLRAANIGLRTQLVETGMVKAHPTFKDIQKPVEAAKQYLKNVGVYAVVIKALNGILNKTDQIEPEGLEEFE